MIRVLCFGTFDGLHPGHDDFLRQVAEAGEEVWVVVARDATIIHVKGQLPAINEQDRLRALQAHPLVHEARLGHEEDKYQVIDEIRPQAIVLGYDQQAFTQGLAEELARRGHSVRIERAKPFQPETYKTSKLRPVPLPTEVDEDENTFPL
ncbi:adenylyltransferase/cytidyltransferase family protein [Patescibacteria group bacterium]|nr:adenylyltransferase/cytidyltransferase family protein [Patescibacteria group bacterium]